MLKKTVYMPVPNSCN